MRYHNLFVFFAVLLSSTAASAVEPSDLKPGLVATFRDSGSAEVTRLEPTVALWLARGEAPHPQLGGLATARWKGYVNITRPGKHVFAANIQGGTIHVSIGGKLVLSGTGTPNEVEIEGGVQTFEATFTSTSTPARVELLWRGPGFVNEPLNNRFLGHLPADRPKAFLTDLEREHGRFLFEELACVKCHKPSANDRMAQSLAERTGPNLTEIAKRAYPGWIDTWLADPSKLRPQSTMPKLFADNEVGRAERYAITKYLISLSGQTVERYRPPFNAPNELRQSIERGRVLYSVAGCAACHQETSPKPKSEEEEREPPKPEDFLYSLGTSGPSAKYPLGALGSKTRPELLAAYLQDPLKTNPAGRMPHMVLNAREATDLARYLCRVTDENVRPEMPVPPKLSPLSLGRDVYRSYFGLRARDELVNFHKLPADKQWSELGGKLVLLKGCVDCHAIEPNGKPIPSGALFPSLDEIKPAGAEGCIGAAPDPARMSVYRLDPSEKTALAAFLKTGLAGPGHPAATYSARVALRRFNCLNCHTRDGEGGIPNDLANQMRLLEKAENADDVRPPLLTGVGHKTRTAWLKSVLTDRGRARPWMQLRMPQYGESNVGFLPEALTHLEGAATDDSIRKFPLNTQTIALGKQIIGKSGLGCISCHDIGGVANTGTRGPDLATINQRVRYEWYDRWMHQPLRLAPGTRMPQAFVDGKSTLTTVLDGDPNGQAVAMWSYLSLGPGLPLPEGLEPPKGLIIAVKDRPQLLRTFMNNAGSKAIAVGYPSGVNLAFSADQCRLSYAWAGNFLDASPVWNNRGGAPAKLLGPKFWTAPQSHPWGLTSNPRIPPDFSARANNPAFGTPLPQEPARLYDGPMAVHFDGYSLDRSGLPTFRYSLNEGGAGAVLRVAETPTPVKASAATGFARHFAVEAPAGYQAWLLAGQSTRDPRLFSSTGARQLDLKAEEPVVPAAGARVVLPEDGDRAVVLEVPNAPEGAVWRFVAKPGGGWLVVLRLPEAKDGWKGMFEVVTWALPKDDDALIKDLAAK